MFHPLDTVRVEKISLYREGWPDESKVNIIAAMEEITIWQDLWSGTIKAVMTLIDPANIYDTFPLIGGEILDIFFKNSTELSPPASMTFVIDSVGERIRSGQQKASTYQLNLCTYDRFKDIRKEFSSSLKGTYTEIVQKILSDKLGTAKQVVVDESQYLQTYINPYISPLNACEMIATRAVGSSLDPFFFYESLSGYNFRSAGSIFSQEPYCKLFIQPTRQGIDERSQRSAYKFEISKSLNRIREQTDFAYGSDIVFFDPVTRMIDFQTMKYNEISSGESYKKIDKYPLIPERDLQVPRRLIYKKADKSHEGEAVRSMVLGLIDHFRVKLSLPGDVGYEPGKIVYLEIPDNSTNKTVSEEVTSGRWLIASVAHTIRKETFFSSIELLKDSYRRDLISEFGGSTGASECVGSSVDYTKLQKEIEEANGIEL